MVKDSRIEVYSFKQTGSIFSDANGNLDLYTTYALNGNLRKIEFLGGNFTATGSFIVSVSGTGERIVNFISGTTLGNVASSRFIFPGAIITDLNQASGLIAALVPNVVNNVIRVQGSGLGAGKSGLGISIYYR